MQLWSLENQKGNYSNIKTINIPDMKPRKRITVAIIVIILISLVAFRLFSNKRSFENQLNMVSELNTTIPVFTDTVEYKHIESGFSTNGDFLPFREVTITAETMGKVISISSETGDSVLKGHILASFDNEVAESQFAQAKFTLEKAEKDMKRVEELSKYDAATIQQFESMKQIFASARYAYTAAKVNSEQAQIRAPFNGILTRRYIEYGTYLTPGAPAFDIVEIDKMKLLTRLTQSEVDKVRKNQVVNITVDAYPGINYEGHVGNIVVKADPSRLYEVEINVKNQAGNVLKPGMYGTINFTSVSELKELVIPRKALEQSIMNPEVFLVSGETVIKKRIIISPLNDMYVVVKSGLKEGDVIVTSGQINLVSGAKISIKN
jgi:membrane fusion protein, multidrug efflux system